MRLASPSQSRDCPGASILTLIDEIFDRFERLGVKVVRDGMPRMSGEDEI
jgi:hypothetical protein